MKIELEVRDIFAMYDYIGKSLDNKRLEKMVLKARQELDPAPIARPLMPSLPRETTEVFREMEAELKEIERVLRVGGCIQERGFDSLADVVASVIQQLKDREATIEELTKRTDTP